MSDRLPDLSAFGLSSTGFLEVDRKIIQIVADDQTRLTPELRSTRVLGKDIYFGQTTYEVGEAPFVQRVDINPAGKVQQLLLAEAGERELPKGFKEKAAKLQEEVLLSEPSESFPHVTGWQLVMTWGYFHLGSYRAQRAGALYQETSRRGMVALQDELPKDPIVVISPVILSNHSTTPHGANEMFGMFGRYNSGDIVPAAVDFGEHPYMEERSFEDKTFMQAAVDDFFAE